MSGGPFSVAAADLNPGCKSPIFLGSDARIDGGGNKSFGVGRVWEPHVGEIFLPPPLPPANSRRRAAFSEGAFKVAPVQPGVGVTEGLMWAQSAL